MMRLLILPLIVSACSAGDNGSPGAHAVLQITFGSDAPTTLVSDVVSNTTNSRLMIQASDGHITVFASLPLPLQTGRVTVSTDGLTAAIWARHDSLPPLIATSGDLTVEGNGSVMNLALMDISKPTDSAGTGILVAGSMTDIRMP